MEGFCLNVLITGTTSGIGCALAKKYAQKGYNLILVSHNEEKLKRQKEQLAHYQVEITTIAKDLSEPNAATEVFEILTNKNLHVDILVNNAGIGQYGKFVNSDARIERKMIALNVLFLTQFTKLILPQMLKRRYGKILNVSSTAAYFPCPYSAVYSATKSYILSFSRALKQELQNTGVSVSVLCPGPTHTNFGRKSQMSRSRLFHTTLSDVRDVAATAYHGFTRGKSVIVPGTANNILIILSKIFPQCIVDVCTKYVLEPV